MNSEDLSSQLDKFLIHVKRVFTIEEIYYVNQPIFEINYPIINSEKINIILKKNDLLNKKKNLAIKLNKIEENDKKRKFYEESVEELNKNLESINGSFDVKDIFITFFNPKSASKFFDAYNLNWLSRFFYICCNQNKIEHL